jgi:hypothetical protein
MRANSRMLLVTTINPSLRALATIQQIDSVYADFTEPVSELLR